MNPLILAIICLGSLLLFTIGGALFSFVKNNKKSDKFSSIVLSLSSGVLIGSAIFCLLREAIEEISTIIPNGWGIFIVISIGIVGFLMMLIFDKIIDRLHEQGEKGKSIKLISAILVHNIPEGLSLGVVIGEVFIDGGVFTMSHAAISLSVVLALHNLIQAITTSFVLKEYGIKSFTSFILVSLTGVLEIAFAVAGIFLASSIEGIVPFINSFAVGIMLFVGIIELLLDSIKKKNIALTIVFLSFGLLLMLLLEILIG